MHEHWLIVLSLIKINQGVLRLWPIESPPSNLSAKKMQLSPSRKYFSKGHPERVHLPKFFTIWIFSWCGHTRDQKLPAAVGPGGCTGSPVAHGLPVFRTSACVIPCCRCGRDMLKAASAVMRAWKLPSAVIIALSYYWHWPWFYPTYHNGSRSLTKDLIPLERFQLSPVVLWHRGNSPCTSSFPHNTQAENKSPQ